MNIGCICPSLNVLLALTPTQLNQAFQLFQGLEQRVSGNRPTEDRLYEFMHEHGQRMEDIEAHLGVLHNSFMEVNDRLNDLDTGRCRCRDVPSTPVLDDPLVSPAISAVSGGEEVVPLMTTVDEEEVPLPLRVRGQRARRSRLFRVNMPLDRGGLARGRLHGGAEGQRRHCRWVGDARTT